MLNDHTTETPPALSEAQILALINERLADVLRRDEFEKRLLEMQLQVHLDATKLVGEKIAEVELRLSANVQTLLDKFDLFTNRLNQWKQVLDERVNNWAGQINRVDSQQAEHDRKLGGLQLAHTRVEGDLKAVTTTIYGDVTREGAPSLYELVNGISSDLRTKNQQTEEKLQEILQMASASAAWISKYEAVQRDRHERRWRWAKAVGNWLGRNQVLAAIITLLLVGLIGVLWPQLAQLLKLYFHLP